jgi:small GTP-binding protein
MLFPSIGESKRRYKVVLVGDSGVGKTSLIHSYLNDDHTFRPTLGATSRCVETVVGDEKIVLNLWDTAGQDNLRNLVPVYARGSHAAILVFDLSNPTTYLHVPAWHDYIVKHVGDVLIWVVGNKADLPIQVECDAALAWASGRGISLTCTSAQTRENVQELFESVARELTVRAKEKQEFVPIESIPAPRLIESDMQSGTPATDGRNCCG